jgi:hypothetical protein
MWNKPLAAQAAAYSSAILTWVEPSGYPISVRVTPQLDDVHEQVTFAALPPVAAGWRGKACLLFHRHNERLEGLHQMVLKGELAEDGGRVVFRVNEFVTANGKPDTDEMPHAGRPIHMFQFLLLGRRKAREYMTKRGAPWPPIPFDDIIRKTAE